MRKPTAEAVSSVKGYKFRDDEAPSSIPSELLDQMKYWCGDADRPAFQQSIWVRISEGPETSPWRSARFMATDGHRMIRADYSTSFPVGAYSVSPDLCELTPVPWLMFPKQIEFAGLWEAKKAVGPWSFDPRYLAELADIERVLTRAYLRENPAKGNTKQKQEARKTAAGRFIACFDLGCSLDPMRIRFGTSGVEAVLMPRSM